MSATFLTCEMERLSQDYGRWDHPVSMNFSLRRSLAWRLFQGSLDAEKLTEQRVCETQEAVRALAQRITLSPDISWNRGLVSSLADRAGLGALVGEMGVPGLVSLARKASAQYGFLEQLPSAGQILERAQLLRFACRVPGQLLRLVSALRPSRRGAPRTRFSLARVATEALEFPFASTVEVFLHDGGRMRREQRVPIGAPGNHERALRDVAREKFHRAAVGLLGRQRTDRAADCLETLGPDQPVSDLVALIAAS